MVRIIHRQLTTVIQLPGFAGLYAYFSIWVGWTIMRMIAQILRSYFIAQFILLGRFYIAWHDAAAGQWPAGYPESARTAYRLEEIRHWLQVFLKRYFANQFKRSALPNGPKVVRGGSLSPRGDWRMPSDASARVWLAELEAHVPASWPNS